MNLFTKKKIMLPPTKQTMTISYTHTYIHTFIYPKHGSSINDLMISKMVSHRNLDSLSPRTLNNEMPSMNSENNTFKTLTTHYS